MLTLSPTLVFILTVIILLSEQACTAQETCVTTVKLSRVQSTVYHYRCGWFGWWRCSGRRYYLAYTDLEVCCKGYEKVNGRCILPNYPPTLDCGLSRFDSSKLIVGGTEASHGEYPWLVSLVRSSHFCGGMVIDDRWIVTAAHCVMGWWNTNFGSMYRIRVGEYDRRVQDTDEVTMEIDKVVPHNDYSFSTGADDIALIRTRDRIRFGDYVKPICLPNKGFSLAKSTRVEIAGWGVTERGTSESSRVASQILQKANVQVDDVTICQLTYGSAFNDEKMICVSDGYGNLQSASCNGDSGGPLMLRSHGQVFGVGVTSYGSSSGCAAGDPVVYTNIAAYVDWIDRIRRT